MLLLGLQVLLGFGYRICFEAMFQRLPETARIAQVVGLGIMTAALGWLIWPAAYHQLSEAGRTSARIVVLATHILDWALLPIGIALGFSAYPLAAALHLPHPKFIGLGFVVVALAIWYGPGLLRFEKKKRQEAISKILQEEEGGHDDDISLRIKNVLIECRMALPGAQAFLGFQFAIVFSEGFQHLARSLQIAHFFSLLATTAAIVLLIAPAAYHRLVEAGRDSEHFHVVASRFLLTALVFLAPGMAGDLLIVLRTVIPSTAVAGAISVAFLLAFYSLWFGVSWLRKRAPEK